MGNASAATFRRFRAPHEDGQTLIDPARPELPATIAASRERMSGICYDLSGRCLSELAAAARRRVVTQALVYTRQYRDVHIAAAEQIVAQNSAVRNPKLLPPVVLSGHQPQLYHPGVWYKNFVLGGLAQQVHGVGVHFLIDSDLCRSVSIRVPSGTAAQPRVESVAYDLPAAEVPYEERKIRDMGTFTSFGERVAAILRPLIAEPLIKEYWPLVTKLSEAQSNLGQVLAQGRHQLEATWQNDTLELPQSAVCQMPEFCWFAAHLLAHLAKFRTAYNGALAAYRAAHRLRNRAQPVPDLAKLNDWREAPLWIWSADDPERRPLFARVRDGGVEISDRDKRTFSLSLTADGNASAAALQLQELARRGIKIRTRALATTLFARLVLGDIFVHGIGGAKYDQVTNLIAREFYGIELPEFATVSATLRLPLGAAARTNGANGQPQGQLRELRYHPERFLVDAGPRGADEMSKVAAIVADKQRWISATKTVQNAGERHRAIVAANEALQDYVAGARQQVERRLADNEELRQSEAIVNSREYSFCLYPRTTFERLLLDGRTQRA